VKIKLAAAHQLSFSDPVSLQKCLGVLQLAASLKQQNLPCEVVDLEEYNHLFNRDFDETMEKVVEKLITPPPDLLGISTMVNNLAAALDICERIKKKLPGVIIVLGGPGISFCANEVISEFPRVDAVIRGEADNAFPQYIEALAAKTKNPTIEGLVYREGEKIVDNGWPKPIEDLDELPMPAYEFCKKNNNKENGAGLFDSFNTVSLEAGRGCPFNCTFCSTSHFFKKKHRLKSVQRIIDEILYLKNKFGYEEIAFHHDILTLQRKYIEELCREIRRQVPGLTWKCSARFDTIDAQILKEMRAAGCNAIFLGIEVATPRMQKIINKHLDLTGFEEKIKQLKDLDYRFDLSFIVGFPEEEPEDIEALLVLALKAKYLCGDNVVIKMYTLVPLLGSALYEQWRDRLVYDEYGSFGASDIPPHWKKLRNKIKRHPGIFSIYYHIPIGTRKWTHACKYLLLSFAIQSMMTRSMKLAYMVLEERLAHIFAHHIDKIALPPPAAINAIEYPLLIESVRQLILEFLKNNPILAAKYDAVSQFEQAFQEVSNREKGSSFKIFPAYYDPGEVIKELETGTTSEETAHGDKKRNFMVFWDEKEKEKKLVEVPADFAD